MGGASAANISGEDGDFMPTNTGHTFYDRDNEEFPSQVIKDIKKIKKK